ncbi:Flagella basal body rod protein [Acididesulfobacillus acetoxydans]|uniref:Flagellar basal-body rod protein FlgC n=1 Tax=Acididesulfobacillus acetoxydans TaxID=1561005 RepID=A0A8S0X723_9FIRM|nr:flagellar basal body rod protein FlgC [Acididesulfobacillus acetoxydans]CAA7602970.1 Flagella basal body rod protein [Acididesulfobacillus acetoxydans]CEJ05852.1 Flagellar basal-body rod protein FlgC [Acididesulfobacillus acetoxydans]
MGIFQAIDASASGLTAQRLRLDLIANNIANVNTTRTGQLTPAGNQIPYRREVAIFEPRPVQPDFARTLDQAFARSSSLDRAAGTGVEVAAIAGDQTPFKLAYNPDSPDAAKTPEPGIPAGYVREPNVNVVTEMVDMVSASRAYEANVTVLNASKGMETKALELGKV